MVQILEPEDETVTRGSPYNFVVLNSPVTGHRGKKDHQSQLVKQILVKPMVLDQVHARLPQCAISNIEEQ